MNVVLYVVCLLLVDIIICWWCGVVNWIVCMDVEEKVLIGIVDMLVFFMLKFVVVCILLIYVR